MNGRWLHCQTCDVPVGDWLLFWAHADAGHAVMHRTAAEGVEP